MRVNYFLIGLVVIMLAVVIYVFPEFMNKVNPPDKYPAQITSKTFPEPQIEFRPSSYVCYHSEFPIYLDGQFIEDDWNNVPWSDYFVDISGNSQAQPEYKTRFKMLWDDNYLYLAVEIEEPHIWAYNKKHDSVIFQENDFEVFIDPDGDNHDYYEYEINALGTDWDLYLSKPYRDKGIAVNAVELQVKKAIKLAGTINNPKDVDKGWKIEMAFPWEKLKDICKTSIPPKEADQWRMNFSRVQWQTEVVNGKYVKKTKNGESIKEDNWVWSPQGLIDMHYPEMWGFVQFCTEQAGDRKIDYVPLLKDDATWQLFQIYYQQKTHQLQYHMYASELERLDVTNFNLPDYIWPPKIFATPNTYELEYKNGRESTILHMNNEGKTWITDAY